MEDCHTPSWMFAGQVFIWGQIIFNLVLGLFNLRNLNNNIKARKALYRISDGKLGSNAQP